MLTMIERGSTEWAQAWRGLQAATGDADTAAECRECGEVWQYMGTVRLSGALVHQFRHRHHPTTATRRYIDVPAGGTR